MRRWNQKLRSISPKQERQCLRFENIIKSIIGINKCMVICEKKMNIDEKLT